MPLVCSDLSFWRRQRVHWDSATHDLRETWNTLGTDRDTSHARANVLARELKLAALFHRTTIIQDSLLLNSAPLFAHMKPERSSGALDPHDVRWLMHGTELAPPAIVLGLRSGAERFLQVHEWIGQNRAQPRLLDGLRSRVILLDEWAHRTDLRVAMMPNDPKRIGGFKQLVETMRAHVHADVAEHLGRYFERDMAEARPRLKPIFDDIYARRRENPHDEVLNKVYSVFKTAKLLANAYEARDTIGEPVMQSWHAKEYALSELLRALPRSTPGTAQLSEWRPYQVPVVEPSVLDALSFKDVHEMRTMEFGIGPFSVYETGRALRNELTLHNVLAHLEATKRVMLRARKISHHESKDWYILLHPDDVPNMLTIVQMVDGVAHFELKLPTVVRPSDDETAWMTVARVLLPNGEDAEFGELRRDLTARLDSEHARLVRSHLRASAAKRDDVIRLASIQDDPM